MMTAESAEYEKALLEKVQFATSTMLSKQFANDSKLSLDEVSSRLAQDMVFSLRQFIAAQQLELVEYRHPADWWQAVKERFAPKWMLIRWPVVNTIHVVEVKALYPRVALPAQEHYVVVFRDTGSSSIVG